MKNVFLILRYLHTFQKISILNLFSKSYKNSLNSDNTKVYSISCDDCKRVYVGQTGRSLNERIKKHRHNSINHDSQYSALANHYQYGQSVSFDSAKIIHSEQNLKKRLIAEALLIRDNSIFSGNTPSFNLQIFG